MKLFEEKIVLRNGDTVMVIVNSDAPESVLLCRNRESISIPHGEVSQLIKFLETAAYRAALAEDSLKTIAKTYLTKAAP